MSIADYIESKALRKQREIKYEIWKAKNRDHRMRAQGAFVGAVAGIAAGLLLAPKSGKNLREDIKNSVDNTINQVKDTTNEFVENAKDSYAGFKDRAYTELQPIEEGFEEGKNVVKKTIEKTKENLKENAKDVKDEAEKLKKEAKDAAKEVGKDIKEGKEEVKEVAKDTKKKMQKM